MLIGYHGQYTRPRASTAAPQRYQRAADALNLDLDTLLPPEYRQATAKVQEWRRFLDSKREQKPEPFTADWIMNTAPNTWGQRLSAHATALAQGNVAGQLNRMATDLDRHAVGNLTGPEAFAHVMATADVDGILTELSDAVAELAAVNVYDPSTPGRDYTRYRAAMNALLSLDVALDPTDATAWAALWFNPGDLRPLRTIVLERFNGAPKRKQADYSAADQAAHESVQVWRDIIRDQDAEGARNVSQHDGSFSVRPNKYRDVAPGDAAVSALAVGDLEEQFGLTLDVATSWDELTRRMRAFDTAGKHEFVDAENVA
ncbi:hypothetical protein ACT3SZ_14415 [Corynebacterium sp. AOP40-9SA-29]|uniref:hypothetical protein n=1 Tax=Corynebacterium sp. AOP40-9SA-29 TaxID=3457677 RepID=UPI0040331727